jgi:flagellin
MIDARNASTAIDQKGSTMSDITLSAGVRQNLLALQNTSKQTNVVNEALATGKKVNSALDNPSSFFTSQSLSNRASDLGSLLDSIGQAVQTLNAADQGITSLTSLVQSAKSIATQAEQATKGSVSYTNITGSVAIAADRSRTTSGATVATADTSATASVKGSYSINLTSLAGAADGNTLQLTDGTTTATFQYLTSSTETATGSDVGFTNAATFKTALTSAFSNATVSGTSTVSIQTTAVQDYSTNYTASGSANLTGLGSATAAVNGDVLTVGDGSHTGTFRYVTGTASAASGTYTDATSLAAAINNANSAVSSDVTASSATGGYLQLDAAKTVTIATGGAISTDLSLSTNTTTDNYNATLAGLSGSLTVQSGSDTANTLTFGTGNGQISTLTQLSTALAGFTDITSTVNGSSKVNFAPQSSANVVVGGAASVLTALGLAAGTTTPTSTVSTASTTRSSLQTQYNNLLTQIDQLAGDASYNGVNLLNGDNLKVTFNETGTSSLTIAGVNLNSTGLGLSQISGTGFQDNNVIDNTVKGLNTALDTLRGQASAFGSNLTTVQTRQDFTNNLISTLQTGSDNLVLADTNQEGADLLALQTRQQLSTTALSFSNQADQAILKIL